MSFVSKECDYVTKLLILFLAGISAHTLSGGSVVNLDQFALYSSVISISLFLTRSVELEGPNLALMVLMLQSCSHFLFGGADKSGDIQMSFAHIIAGAVSYKAISHFDTFWDFLQSIADAVYFKKFHRFTPIFRRTLLPSGALREPHTNVIFTSLQFRGPPLGESK